MGVDTYGDLEFGKKKHRAKMRLSIELQGGQPMLVMAGHNIYSHNGTDTPGTRFVVKSQISRDDLAALLVESAAVLHRNLASDDDREEGLKRSKDVRLVITHDGTVHATRAVSLDTQRFDGSEAIFSFKLHDEIEEVLIATSDGRGFRVDVTDLPHEEGSRAKKPYSGDAEIIAFLPLERDHTHVAAVATNRKALIFRRDELPSYKTAGRGNLLMKSVDGPIRRNRVSDVSAVKMSEGLSWRGKDGSLQTITDLKTWLGKIGGIGSMAPRGFPLDNRFTR